MAGQRVVFSDQYLGQTSSKRLRRAGPCATFLISGVYHDRVSTGGVDERIAFHRVRGGEVFLG